MRKPPAHMHNPLKAKRKEITTCFKFFNRYLLFLYKQNCTDNFLNYYLPHFICSHDRLFTKVKTINITHGINEIARTSAPLARAAAALGAASTRPARQPASRRAAAAPSPVQLFWVDYSQTIVTRIGKHVLGVNDHCKAFTIWQHIDCCKITKL